MVIASGNHTLQHYQTNSNTLILFCFNNKSWWFGQVFSIFCAFIDEPSCPNPSLFKSFLIVDLNCCNDSLFTERLLQVGLWLVTLFRCTQSFTHQENSSIIHFVFMKSVPTSCFSSLLCSIHPDMASFDSCVCDSESSVILYSIWPLTCTDNTTA